MQKYIFKNLSINSQGCLLILDIGCFHIVTVNYEELVADARETLARDGVELPVAGQVESYTPGTSAWFRKIIEVVK